MVALLWKFVAGIKASRCSEVNPTIRYLLLCTVLDVTISLCYVTILEFLFLGLPQHSSVTSIASSSLSGGGAASYYQQTSGPDHTQHSPTKYPENGHDTLSDFVTFVCQEAENTQQGSQVFIIFKYSTTWWIICNMQTTIILNNL